MNKREAENFVRLFNEDDRRDLLMYLAEFFNYRTIDKDLSDETYFLSTGCDGDSYKELDLLLSQNGWELKCQSPLEISEKEDPESRATGYAAQMVIDALEAG